MSIRPSHKSQYDWVKSVDWSQILWVNRSGDSSSYYTFTEYDPREDSGVQCETCYSNALLFSRNPNVHAPGDTAPEGYSDSFSYWYDMDKGAYIQLHAGLHTRYYGVTSPEDSGIAQCEWCIAEEYIRDNASYRWVNPEAYLPPVISPEAVICFWLQAEQLHYSLEARDEAMESQRLWEAARAREAAAEDPWSSAPADDDTPPF